MIRYKTFAILTSLFVFGMFVTTASVFGGEADIKARMEERLPVINDLKAGGIIGENNNGYLEFLSEERGREEIVNSENMDRRKVYEAIARQHGSTTENVGKQRAGKIMQRAARGEWLQDDRGNWHQK